MIAAFRKRWEQLQERERQVLLGGVIALVVMGGYALVWEPYATSVTQLEQDVAEQRALLQWLKRSAQEVQQLRRTRPAGAAGGAQSLMALTDGSARAQGLGTALQRVEPEGANVRVWLEKAAFDDVLRWLDRLAEERGVRVNSFASERVPDQPGLVNVRLVLEKGA